MRQLKITKKITNRESESINAYFSEVSKINLLTDEEEYNLAERITRGDKEALDSLVKANLRFVVSVAKQYQNQGVRLEDLINEGNIGLIKAAQKFDNSRGFKFISYAVWWIRQTILQCISEQSRMIRIPNNQSASVQRVKRVSGQLEQQLEREPTLAELEEALIGTDIKVREVLTIVGKTVSLDAPVQESEDMVYLDYIANADSPSPDEGFYKEGLAHDLDIALSRLTPKQKRIVCMYYGILGYQQMTLEEIGDYFDLTRERVRQIKDGALRVLKCKDNSSLLRNYLTV